MQLERLLRLAEVVGPGFPQLDPDEYGGDVEAIAAIVRRGWNLPPGPLLSVTDALEEAGGVLLPFDFGSSNVDAMSQWLPGLPPIFYLNTHFPGDRTRWSCCHELGHMIMHRFVAPTAEEEANRFAAEFLMPARDIRQELYNLDLPKLAALKQYWKVSMQALLKRATDLQTVTPRQARRLWMTIGKLGIRKLEPYPLAPERPTLYSEIFDFHRRQLGYSVSELAELLGESEIQTAWMKRDGDLSVVA